MKKILFTILSALVVPLTAHADACTEALGMPFTAAQRVKLCASFGSSIINSLIPTTTNTYDLGSASKTWRTLYTGTSRIALTSDILRVRQDAQRLFTWDGSSDTALTMTFGDSTTAVQKFTLSASTADAADDSSTILCGGGAYGTTGSRGSCITLAGEEVSGGGDITYNAAASDVHIFQIADTAEVTIKNDEIEFTATGKIDATTSIALAIADTAELTLTDNQLAFSGATNEIVPGATSISLRNNADNADNFICVDAGTCTVRAGLTVTAGNTALTNGNLTFGTATKGVNFTVGTVAAAGSNQGDATAMTDRNTYVTAADGAKGVKFPALAVGEEWIVWNRAASALLVYPPSGTAINSNANDASVSVAANAALYCTTITSGVINCMEGANP